MEFVITAAITVAKLCVVAAMIWVFLRMRAIWPAIRNDASAAAAPGRRRRFQFGTTALLGGMAVAALVALTLRETKRTPLEGTWRGSGSRFADCSLAVRLDRMTLVSHGQAQTFRCEFSRRWEETDLYGANGVQFGVYMIKYGDQLLLQLANPGEARPQNVGPASNSQSQFFKFDRDR